MRYKHLKNLNGTTRENLGEIEAIFRKEVRKTPIDGEAKHKFQKLVSNPANQKLVEFLDELQKMAEDAFEIAAHSIFEQFI